MNFVAPKPQSKVLYSEDNVEIEEVSTLTYLNSGDGHVVVGTRPKIQIVVTLYGPLSMDGNYDSYILDMTHIHQADNWPQHIAALLRMGPHKSLDLEPLARIGSMS